MFGKRTKHFLNLVVPSYRMTAVLLMLWFVGVGDGQKSAPKLADMACQVSDDDPTWAEPVTYYPVNGRTSVTLSVQFGEGMIGKDYIRHRSYNGNLVGPVIRTRPGHKLIVNLQNNLPIDPTDIDPPVDMTDPHALEVPHGFNTTNLHTHGLHVTPKDPSDNVFLKIDPLTKKQAKYTFDIPSDHPAGTFWYHAHKHGSVAYQLSSGMAGTLIVEGGLDDYPGLRGIRERIMVFQQIVYRSIPGQPAQIFPQDIYSDLPGLPAAPNKTSVTVINGQLIPIITMRPGEIQRWRMIHAGLQTTINVHLEDNTLVEIALDGIPLKKRRLVSYTNLEPGYRSDVLVKASLKPGTYCLYNSVSDPKVALRGRVVAPKTLAKIVVEGEKDDMPMPDATQMTAWVNDLIEKKHPQLKDIDPKEITNRRTLKFQHDNNKVFYIDGRTFEENRIDQKIQLGTVEEWCIQSLSDKHPFHIHVNPFQLQLAYPDGSSAWVWRDTILVPEKETVTIRSRFLDFDGKTVLHCHNLDHEDQGMMQAIEIVKKGPAAGVSRNDFLPPARGLSGLPRAAPDWSLKDAEGVLIRRTSFVGRNLLLVFHRGLDCLHCSEQIKALAKKMPEFRALDIEIVAISPKWPSVEALRVAREQLGITFPLLADPDLEIFRRYGCHDQQPLHGVFLIDPAGQVRWQSIGDQPETDVTRLLNLAREHLPKDRRDSGKPRVSQAKNVSGSPTNP